jgi:hypothetical protein
MSWPTNAVTRGGERYDLVFDVVGNHPFSAYRRVLATDGTYVLIGHDQFGTQGRRWLGSIPEMCSLMARSTVEPRLPRPTFEAPNRRRSTTRLHDVLEDGSLTPIVAHTFPLEQVPRRHRVPRFRTRARSRSLSCRKARAARPTSSRHHRCRHRMASGSPDGPRRPPPVAHPRRVDMIGRGELTRRP